MNQEKKTFAILFKVNDKPLLFSQCASEKYCSPLAVMRDLRSCLVSVSWYVGSGILDRFRKTGKVDEDTFNAFIVAILRTIMFIGKRKYRLDKRDSKKLWDFAVKYYPNAPTHVVNRERKKKSTEEVFTMCLEHMDDALKSADNYAIINLTEDLEVILEDLVFLQNDSLESRLTFFLEPFDAAELVEFSKQNPTKKELINFLGMITVMENHRLKIFNGSVKDNLKIIYDSSETDKKIPFKIVKITPSSNDDEVVRIHWPSTISFGTRSLPIFFEQNNGKVIIDFLPYV